MKGTGKLLGAFLVLQFVISSIGEIQYSSYRILPGSGRYPYAQTYTYIPERSSSYQYPCTTYPYKCVLSPSRYSTSDYKDDNLYITDMYGQTRVVGRSQYQRAASLSNPCSSCGQNAQCSIISSRTVCSCLKGYTGDPLSYCRRAECLETSECRGHQTCRNEKCVDACEGVCGVNANCEARSHLPVCSCPEGFTGDPSHNCRRFDPSELCHPSPCGQNTLCEVVNEIPTCKCLPGYQGSPISGCRHECESDAECGPQLACLEFSCQNPCHSQCGINAECEGVRNHLAVCKCPRGYLGSPYSGCQPECTSNTDCPAHKPACYYNSCKNPCDGVCGIGANCELRGVTPICSCPRDMTGDPFVRCRPFEKQDLCASNPCGLNAQCQPGYDRTNQERPVCTCLPGHIGDPLTSCQRGECTEDGNCADSQTCIDYKCQNPCIGQCGSNANCNARRHLAVCTCPTGYNGDALISCYPVSSSRVARY